MRTGVLFRDEDETGISGTGVVAELVEFSDGVVVIRWQAPAWPDRQHNSTVVWNGIDDVLAIHGHNGKTRIVWAE